MLPHLQIHLSVEKEILKASTLNSFTKEIAELPQFFVSNYSEEDCSLNSPGATHDIPFSEGNDPEKAVFLQESFQEHFILSSN